MGLVHQITKGMVMIWCTKFQKLRHGFGTLNYGGYDHESAVLSTGGLQRLHPIDIRATTRTPLANGLKTLTNNSMRNAHSFCRNADYLFMHSLSSLKGR